MYKYEDAGLWGAPCLLCKQPCNLVLICLSRDDSELSFDDSLLLSAFALMIVAFNRARLWSVTGPDLGDIPEARDQRLLRFRSSTTCNADGRALSHLTGQRNWSLAI